MIRFLTVLFFAFALLINIAAVAQNGEAQPGTAGTVEMADTMRAEGKIYVIVAIILIVLAGVFIYLFLLDRKVQRLENLLREKHEKTK